VIDVCSWFIKSYHPYFVPFVYISCEIVFGKGWDSFPTISHIHEKFHNLFRVKTICDFEMVTASSHSLVRHAWISLRENFCVTGLSFTVTLISLHYSSICDQRKILRVTHRFFWTSKSVSSLMLPCWLVTVRMEVTYVPQKTATSTLAFYMAYFAVHSRATWSCRVLSFL